MQCTNKILRQWNFLHSGLFGHHSQTYVACRHRLNISHIRLADYLAEKQQYFRLTISKRITLDVIAIVVEIYGKTTAKPLPIFLG